MCRLDKQPVQDEPCSRNARSMYDTAHGWVGIRYNQLTLHTVISATGRVARRGTVLLSQVTCSSSAAHLEPMVLQPYERKRLLLASFSHHTTKICILQTGRLLYTPAHMIRHVLLQCAGQLEPMGKGHQHLHQAQCRHQAALRHQQGRDSTAPAVRWHRPITAAPASTGSSPLRGLNWAHTAVQQLEVVGVGPQTTAESVRPQTTAESVRPQTTAESVAQLCLTQQCMMHSGEAAWYTVSCLLWGQEYTYMLLSTADRGQVRPRVAGWWGGLVVCHSRAKHSSGSVPQLSEEHCGTHALPHSCTLLPCSGMSTALPPLAGSEVLCLSGCRINAPKAPRQSAVRRTCCCIGFFRRCYYYCCCCCRSILGKRGKQRPLSLASAAAARLCSTPPPTTPLLPPPNATSHTDTTLCSSLMTQLAALTATAGPCGRRAGRWIQCPRAALPAAWCSKVQRWHIPHPARTEG
jgi:hypothetical protein